MNALMLGNKDQVRELVIDVLWGALDMYEAMNEDCPGGELTFPTVAGVKDLAGEQLECILEEFRELVHETLRDIHIQVDNKIKLKSTLRLED